MARPNWDMGRLAVDLSVPGNHFAVSEQEAAPVSYEVILSARLGRTSFLPPPLATIEIESSDPEMVGGLVHCSR